MTGASTGAETPIDRLREVQHACPSVPVYVGSGLTTGNAAGLLRVADGAIVGSSLKIEGVITGPVDRERVRELVRVVRTL